MIEYILSNNQNIFITVKFFNLNKMEVPRDIYYFSIPLLQTICVFLMPLCIFYLIKRMGAAESFVYS